MKRIALALLVLASLIVVPTAAAAEIWWITEDTVLEADHSGPIGIVGDDVDLDCAGHTITGDGSIVGINVLGGARVTVTDCSVKEFVVGIQLGDTTDSFVRENRTNLNEEGIRVAGGSGNSVIGNDANRNSSWGIIVHLATGTHIAHNTTNRNGFLGIAVNTAVGTVVVGNTANANQGTGIEDLDATDSIFRDNIAVANAGAGFHSFGSVAGTFAHNTIRNNRETGVAVNNSMSMTIDDNVVTGNDVGGIYLYLGSTDNLITGNTACHNRHFDARDESGGSNVWIDNDFCGAELP